MEIGIVAQKGNDQAVSVASEVCRAVEAMGIEVDIDGATASEIGRVGTDISDMDGCAFVVSVGGDGTFLFVARHVGGTPILGVNLGEVGFLNVASPDEAVSRVRAEIERIDEQGHPRFRAVDRLIADVADWSLPPAMNEIVVLGERRGRNNGITATVRIDGSVYFEGSMDGVLVATQTGSTAYNLSEGGPLMHPGVDGVVVTGMCSTESVPSLVIAPDQDIDVRVSDGTGVVVSSDGQNQEMDAPCTVSIRRADEPGRIVGADPEFFRAIDKIG